MTSSLRSPRENDDADLNFNYNCPIAGFGNTILKLKRFFKDAASHPILSKYAPPGGVKYAEGGVDHEGVKVRRQERRVELQLEEDEEKRRDSEMQVSERSE